MPLDHIVHRQNSSQRIPDRRNNQKPDVGKRDYKTQASE